jgi:hypothetical protein
MFVIKKEIELFSVYMAAGIIAYDPDIKRYVGIGKGPGILLVDLGRTKEDVIEYLKTHPEPTDW